MDDIDAENKAFLETDRYIYKNPFTRFLMIRGHKVCAKLRKNKNCPVLDMGCGTGDHFPYIQSEKIIGLDILDEMLNKARKKYPNAELIKGDIFSMPFENKSIESIVSHSVLEHLSPLEGAVKEIHRILSDDGEFIFAIPTEGLLYILGRKLTTRRHVEKATGVDYEELLKKQHVNKCADIIAMLKKYFLLKKLRGVPFLIPSINLNAFLVGRCVKKKNKKQGD